MAEPKPRRADPGAGPIRTARCCCGALSIRLRGEPVVNALCHCDDCRRRTGSAFGWSTYFRDEDVEAIDGAATDYATATGSGTRSFCPRCGSTLYWRAAGFAGVIGVAGGSFVEQPIAAPTASYRDSRRCHWLDLPRAWERNG